MAETKTAEDELFAAIQEGDETRLLHALTRGASPNACRFYETYIDRTRYEGSTSALMSAVICGQTTLAKRLLEKGAKPNAEDAFSKRTPLVEAAERGPLEMVELLLDNGADVSRQDGIDAENALTLAIKGGHAAIAAKLLRAGTPLLANALEHAVRLDREDLVDLCLEAGLNPTNTRALQTAAMFGRVSMIRLLASQGVNLEKVGEEALVSAANAGQAEATRCLLSLGVPVESKTSYGWSALLCAAYNGNADTLRVLLDAGADPNTKDESGKTARDWAKERGKADNVKVLDEALRT